MLSEKDLRGLQRILSHCERVIRYVPSNLSLEEFVNDDEKQDATVFNITQIGELANSVLSAECKMATPAVEWNALIRMRHKIVHHYDVYSAEFAWAAATQEIPALMREVRNYVFAQRQPQEDRSSAHSDSFRKMNL